MHDVQDPESAEEWMVVAGRSAVPLEPEAGEAELVDPVRAGGRRGAAPAARTAGGVAPTAGGVAPTAGGVAPTAGGGVAPTAGVAHQPAGEVSACACPHKGALHRRRRCACSDAPCLCIANPAAMPLQPQHPQLMQRLPPLSPPCSLCCGGAAGRRPLAALRVEVPPPGPAPPRTPGRRSLCCKRLTLVRFNVPG